MYCMVCGSSFCQCDGQRAADTGARPHIAVDTGDGACRRPPLGGRTRLVVIIIIIVELFELIQHERSISRCNVSNSQSSNTSLLYSGYCTVVDSQLLLLTLSIRVTSLSDSQLLLITLSIQVTSLSLTHSSCYSHSLFRLLHFAQCRRRAYRPYAARSSTYPRSERSRSSLRVKPTTVQHR